MVKLSKALCSVLFIFGLLFPLWGCGDPLANISLSLACPDFSKEGYNISLIVDDDNPEKAEATIEASVKGLSKDMLNTIDWKYDNRFLKLEKNADGHSVVIKGINPTTASTQVVAYSLENVKAQAVVNVSVEVKIKEVEAKQGDTFGIPVNTEFALYPQDLLNFTPANASIPPYTFTIRYGTREKIVASGEKFTIDSTGLTTQDVSITCSPIVSSLYTRTDVQNLQCEVTKAILYTPLSLSNIFVGCGENPDAYSELELIDDSGNITLDESLIIIHNDPEKSAIYFGLSSSMDRENQYIIVEQCGAWLVVDGGERLIATENLDKYVLYQDEYDTDSNIYKFCLQGIDVVEDLKIDLAVRLGNVSNSIVKHVIIPINVVSKPNKINVNNDYTDAAIYTKVNNKSKSVLNVELLPDTANYGAALQIRGLSSSDYSAEFIESLNLPAQYNDYKKLEALTFTINGSEFTAIGLKNGEGTGEIADVSTPLGLEWNRAEENYAIELLNTGNSCGIVVLCVEVKESPEVYRYIILNLLQSASVIMDCQQGEQSPLSLDSDYGNISLALACGFGEVVEDEGEVGEEGEGASIIYDTATIRFKMRVNNQTVGYNSGLVEGNFVSCSVSDNNLGIIEISTSSFDANGFIAVGEDGWGQFEVKAKRNGYAEITLMPQSGQSTKIGVYVYSQPSSLSIKMMPPQDVTTTVGVEAGYVDIRKAENQCLVSGDAVLLANRSEFTIQVMVDGDAIRNAANLRISSILPEAQDGCEEVTKLNSRSVSEYALFIGDEEYDKFRSEFKISITYNKVAKDERTGRFYLVTSQSSSISFTFKVTTFNPIENINIFKQNITEVPINKVDLLTTKAASLTESPDDYSDLQGAIASSQNIQIGLDGIVDKAGLKMANKVTCVFDSSIIDISIYSPTPLLGGSEGAELSPPEDEGEGEPPAAPEAETESESETESLSSLEINIQNNPVLVIQARPFTSAQLDRIITVVIFEVEDFNGEKYSVELNVVINAYSSITYINVSNRKNNGESVERVDEEIRLEPYRQLGYSFDARFTSTNSNIALNESLYVIIASAYVKPADSTELSIKYNEVDYVLTEFKANRYNLSDLEIEDWTPELENNLLSVSVVSDGNKFLFELDGNPNKSGYAFVFLIPTFTLTQDPSTLQLASLVYLSNMNNEIMLFHVPKGDDADPYFVTSRQDLIDIGRAMDKSYAIIQDIDLGSRDVWTPIGVTESGVETFTGTLMSQGALLSGFNNNTQFTLFGLNLNTKVDASTCYGLFAKVGLGAKFINFNIEVESYKIDNDGGLSEASYLGILTGLIEKTVEAESEEIIEDPGEGAGTPFEDPEGGVAPDAEPAEPEPKPESESEAELEIEEPQYVEIYGVNIACKTLQVTSDISAYVGAIGYVTEGVTAIVKNVEVDYQLVKLEGSVNWGGLVGLNEGIVSRFVTSIDPDTEEEITSDVVFEDDMSSYLKPDKSRNVVNANITISKLGEELVLVGLGVAKNNGKVTNIEVSGQINYESDESVIGGIAGENNGALAQVRSYVEIKRTTTPNIKDNIVGGIVGKNSGNVVSADYEIASYGTDLTGIKADGIVGGLIGEMSSGSIMFSRVFANILDSDVASIVLVDEGIVGGLVGQIAIQGVCSISQSLVFANVQVDQGLFGGLVGKIINNWESDETTGYVVVISDSYIESVLIVDAEATPTLGAFVGSIEHGANANLCDLNLSYVYAVIPSITSDIAQSIAYVDNDGELEQTVYDAAGLINKDTVVINDGAYDYSTFTDKDEWEDGEIYPTLVNNKIIILTGITLVVDDVKILNVTEATKFAADKVIININKNEESILASNLFKIGYIPDDADHDVVITSSNDSIVSITKPNSWTDCTLTLHRTGTVWLTVFSRADANVFARVQLAVVYGFDNIDYAVSKPLKLESGNIEAFVGDDGIISITYKNGTNETNIENINGGVYVTNTSENYIAIRGTDLGSNKYDIDNVGQFTITALKATETDVIITISPYIKVYFYDGEVLELNRVSLDTIYNLEFKINDGTDNIEFNVKTSVAQSSEKIQGIIYFRTNEKSNVTLINEDDKLLTYTLSGSTLNDSNEEVVLTDLGSKVILTLGPEEIDAFGYGSVAFNLELADSFKRLEKSVFLKLTVKATSTEKKNEIDFEFTPQRDLHVGVKFYSDITNNSLDLDNAGYLDSTTILPGHFGLLVVDVTPEYADFDSITITSASIKNEQIYVSQRVRKIEWNETNSRWEYTYEIWQEGVAEIDSGLRLANVSDYSETFDGTYYVRLLTAGGLSVGTKIPLTITLLKGSNSIFTKVITLEVRDVGLLSMTYNENRYMKYSQGVNWYYVAAGTGSASETLSQNTNEIFVHAGIEYRNINVSLTDGDTSGAVIRKEDGRYFLDTTSCSPGVDIHVQLTAQMEVNGRMRTDYYYLNFYVVDIFIDGITISTTNLVGDTDVLNLAYVIDKKYYLKLYNSCYDSEGNLKIDRVKELGLITCNYSVMETKLREVIETMQITDNWTFNNEKLAIDEWYEECFKYARGDNNNFYLISKRASQAPCDLTYNLYYSYTNGQIQINTSPSVGGVEKVKTISLNFYQILSKNNPNPIFTLDDLLTMKDGYHYIMMDNITIPSTMQWVPMNKNILSLDGNGYNIIFGDEDGVSTFAKNNSNRYGLFEQVSNTTVLKNVNVKFYNTNGIILPEGAQEFGALAAVNNGIIYNCLVGGLNGTVLVSMTSITNAGGLVAQNSSGAYITNSRVENFGLHSNGVGALGGLVSQNAGYISSSYYNGGTLSTGNAYDGKFSAGGLVETNTGSIWGSFAGLVQKVDSQLIYNSYINSTTSAGFVVRNTGSIIDCFAAIDIRQGISGSSSGFVHTNSGSIARVYALSTIHQANGSGVTGCEPLVTNLSGSMVNAYYVDTNYLVKRNGIQLVLSELSNSKLFVNYVFANNEFDGVWVQNGLESNVYFTTSRFNHIGPMLVSASLIATPCLSYNKDESQGGDTEESTLYFYTRNASTYFKKEVLSVGNYNTDYQYDPIVITSAEELNDAFNFASESDYTIESYSNVIDGNVLVDSMRLIRNINYSVFNNNSIYYSPRASYAGLLEGNGYSISNVKLQYTSSNQTDVFALFGKVVSVSIEGNEVLKGTLQNFTITIVSIDGRNASCVGALIGELNSGAVINVNLKGVNANSTVVGRHVAGGLVGMVLGNSLIRYVSTDISVSVTHIGNEQVLYNDDIIRLISQSYPETIAIADGSELVASDITQLGYAGGVVGILDSNSNEGDIEFVVAKVNGQIIGKVAGGFAGLLGAYAIINQTDVLVSGSAKITARVISGGLIGENHGIIRLSTVDYSGGSGNNIFEIGANVVSKSYATGGLVGLNVGLNIDKQQEKYASGQIILSGSYVDVKNSYANNVGGLVGVTIGGKLMGVFASGNVEGKYNSKTAGLIGLVDSEFSEPWEFNLFTYSTKQTDSEYISNTTVSPTIRLELGNAVAYNTTVNSGKGFLNDSGSSTIVWYSGNYSFVTDANATTIPTSNQNTLYSAWDSVYYTFANKYGKTLPIKSTEPNPRVIEINTPEDMWKVYWHPELSYVVTTDLDLRGANIPLIGTLSQPFTGSITSNSDATSSKAVVTITLDSGVKHFIGVTDGNAIIKNILVEGSASSDFTFVDTNNGNLTIEYTNNITTQENATYANYDSYMPILVRNNNKSFVLILPGNGASGTSINAGGSSAGGTTFNTVVLNNATNASVKITANTTANLEVLTSIITNNYGNLALNNLKLFYDKIELVEFATDAKLSITGCDISLGSSANSLVTENTNSLIITLSRSKFNVNNIVATNSSTANIEFSINEMYNASTETHYLANVTLVGTNEGSIVIVNSNFNCDSLVNSNSGSISISNSFTERTISIANYNAQINSISGDELLTLKISSISSSLGSLLNTIQSNAELRVLLDLTTATSLSSADGKIVNNNLGTLTVSSTMGSELLSLSYVVNSSNGNLIIDGAKLNVVAAINSVGDSNTNLTIKNSTFTATNLVETNNGKVFISVEDNNMINNNLVLVGTNDTDRHVVIQNSILNCDKLCDLNLGSVTISSSTVDVDEIDVNSVTINDSTVTIGTLTQALSSASGNNTITVDALGEGLSYISNSYYGLTNLTIGSGSPISIAKLVNTQSSDTLVLKNSYLTVSGQLGVDNLDLNSSVITVTNATTLNITSQETSSLTISSNTGSITINNSGTLSVENPSDSRVSIINSGSLSVVNAGTMTVTCVGESASLTVTSNTGTLSVINNGTMNIINPSGSTVSITNSGTLNISNAGTMTITNSGDSASITIASNNTLSVTNNGTLSIVNPSGSTVSITNTGALSVLNGGTLNITSTGVSSSMVIASNTGIINFENSTISNNGLLGSSSGVINLNGGNYVINDILARAINSVSGTCVLYLNSATSQLVSTVNSGANLTINLVEAEISNADNLVGTNNGTLVINIQSSTIELASAGGLVNVNNGTLSVNFVDEYSNLVNVSYIVGTAGEGSTLNLLGVSYGY